MLFILRPGASTNLETICNVSLSLISFSLCTRHKHHSLLWFHDCSYPILTQYVVGPNSASLEEVPQGLLTGIIWTRSSYCLFHFLKSAQTLLEYPHCAYSLSYILEISKFILRTHDFLHSFIAFRKRLLPPDFPFLATFLHYDCTVWSSYLRRNGKFTVLQTTQEFEYNVFISTHTQTCEYKQIL